MIKHILMCVVLTRVVWSLCFGNTCWCCYSAACWSDPADDRGVVSGGRLCSSRSSLAVKPPAGTACRSGRPVNQTNASVTQTPTRSSIAAFRLTANQSAAYLQHGVQQANLARLLSSLREGESLRRSHSRDALDDPLHARTIHQHVLLFCSQTAHEQREVNALQQDLRTRTRDASEKSAETFLKIS